MLVIKTPIYNTQIVDQNETTPCIARTYQDGQWRQCRLQCYKLFPLIAEPLIDEPTSEVIAGLDGLPIYVASVLESSIPEIPENAVFSIDGYLLTDINGLILTTKEG